MDLFQKIKNLIKVGLKKNTIDTKFVEVEYLGKKPQQALLIIPYGLHFNAPSDILSIIFQGDGSEDFLLSFLTDSENRDNLESKEFAIGIPSKNGRLKHDKDGNWIFTDDNNNTLVLNSDGITLEDKNGNKQEMKSGSMDWTGTILKFLAASESFLKGDTWKTNWTTFNTSVQAAVPGDTTANAAAITAIKAAFAIFAAQLTNMLSTKIKGE